MPGREHDIIETETSFRPLQIFIRAIKSSACIWDMEMEPAGDLGAYEKAMETVENKNGFMQ